MNFPKKLSEKTILLKRNKWFLFFFTTFLGFLIPLKPAHAAFYDFIVKPLTSLVIGIPSFIIALTFQITLAISIVFAALSAWLLKFTIEFTGRIPITHCPCPPAAVCPPFPQNCAVAIGWTFSRDLANIFFILILVFIAFAYILNVETFGMKKALPKLIIIALLINFSTVFIGLLVDISRIIMNTFTSAISFSNVLDQFGTLFRGGEGIVSVIKSGFNATKAIAFLVQTIALIVFNLVMGLVLFLYALLFIFRIVALWVVTIFAPIAFLCYILPQTKNWWDKWLHHLLTWAFVGVLAMIFLFLGFVLAATMPSYGLGVVDNPGFGMSGLVTAMLPYLVPLVFLYIGLKLTLSGAPAGADKLIGLGKVAAIAATGFAGGAAIGALRGSQMISGAEQRAIQRLETLPVVGRALGGPGAFETQKKTRIDAAVKNLEKIPDTPSGNKALSERISRHPLTDRDRTEKAAAVELLAKRKELKFKNDTEAARVLSEAQTRGTNIKAILEARPDLAPNLKDPKTGKPMTVDQAMAKIEPADFTKNVQKEALSNDDVVRNALSDQRKIVLMGRNMKKEYKEEFKKQINSFTLAGKHNKLSAAEKNKFESGMDRVLSDENWL